MAPALLLHKLPDGFLGIVAGNRDELPARVAGVGDLMESLSLRVTLLAALGAGSFPNR